MLPPLPLPPLPALQPTRYKMSDKLYGDAAWELYKERGGGWIPEADIQQRAKEIAVRPKPVPLPPLPPLPALPALPPLPLPPLPLPPLPKVSA